MLFSTFSNFKHKSLSFFFHPLSCFTLSSPSLPAFSFFSFPFPDLPFIFPFLFLNTQTGRKIQRPSTPSWDMQSLLLPLSSSQDLHHWLFQVLLHLQHLPWQIEPTQLQEQQLQVVSSPFHLQSQRKTLPFQWSLQPHQETSFQPSDSTHSHQPRGSRSQTPWQEQLQTQL